MIDYYYYGDNVKAKFNGSCLKQLNKLAYSYGIKVNIYIVYELGASGSNDSDPTLKNCLFGAVTFTKNADIENMDIPAMELDLIEDQHFHFLVVDLVKMYYFLE